MLCCAVLVCLSEVSVMVCLCGRVEYKASIKEYLWADYYFLCIAHSWQYCTIQRLKAKS